MRAYKTRTSAKDACVAGRVKVNDVVAKPATRIGPGDVVEARRRDRTLIHVVVRTIEKRVSAAVAAECLEDRSPPPPEPSSLDPLTAPLPGARERGAGRPTKRDRRLMGRLRGRGGRPPGT